MTLSILVAVSSNGAIGKDNRLPWKISADLKRFKKLTMGHPIIMGRKTWDSIGRPLPGRANIVITRDRKLSAEGAIVVHSLEEALAAAARSDGSDEVFVIGGEQIYQMALSRADRVYLTRVHIPIEGDAFFPELDGEIYSETAREKGEGEPRHTFHIYEKGRAAA